MIAIIKGSNEEVEVLQVASKMIDIGTDGKKAIVLDVIYITSEGELKVLPSNKLKIKMKKAEAKKEQSKILVPSILG